VRKCAVVDLTLCLDRHYLPARTASSFFAAWYSSVR
jgi:hypothetical protein